ADLDNPTFDESVVGGFVSESAQVIAQSKTERHQHSRRQRNSERRTLEHGCLRFRGIEFNGGFLQLFRRAFTFGDRRQFQCSSCFRHRSPLRTKATLTSRRERAPRFPSFLPTKSFCAP